MQMIADDFERELLTFQNEVEEATQYFYVNITAHNAAREHEQIRELFDRDALFWNTTLGGLIPASIMGLGRIFDQDSPHNVDAVIRVAQSSLLIFSKDAFRERRKMISHIPISSMHF